MQKLNIGSGEFLKDGFVNVDYYSVSKPDVVHDLTKFPYPFKNDYFDWVESDHCFEHLPNPFAVMKEVHRISKNGAKVIIRVPHFSRGFTHAEHKAGFDVTFPYYFNKNFKGGYQGFEFECTKMKLRWFAQPYLKKTVLSNFSFTIALYLGKILDFFANLSPFACSRIWCFWCGGFEEIEFHFNVKK
jgi:SAM-dependent methyltransferase